MFVARKLGKLRGQLVENKHNLEYWENSLSIQKKAFHKYYSDAIVDDLLANGGTLNCVSKILKETIKNWPVF